jgi:hypothetical protein
MNNGIHLIESKGTRITITNRSTNESITLKLRIDQVQKLIDVIMNRD